MRLVLAAAGAAWCLAGAAQAALVDLTYTIEAEVTGYEEFDSYCVWFGACGISHAPEIGDLRTLVLELTVDTGLERFQYWEGTFYDDFSAGTGAIYYWAEDGDSFSQFDLLADGTGDARVYYGNGMDYEDTFYDVLLWSVDGLPAAEPLPDLAPVPLPASLPLLAVGLGGIGVVSRRRRQPDPR